MTITAAFRFCTRFAWVAGIFLVAGVRDGRAQTDDFADGNDTGWTRYAPLADFGAATSFTVTGGVYRLSCAPSPNASQLGPARAGSLRQDVRYRDFCVSVDLKAWNPAEDTSMGVLARLQPGPGLGTTNGYAFTYQGKDHDVQLSTVTQEAAVSLGRMPVTLTPGGNYRLVLMGVGTTLEGRVYDMNDPLTPLAMVSATDATYAEGTCGLVIFADENTRTSADFDNYSASAGNIAPPVLTVGGGELKLTWDVASGLCHSLESSVDLETWFPLTTQGAQEGRFFYAEPFGAANSPWAFYRLRMGPPVNIGAK